MVLSGEPNNAFPVNTEAVAKWFTRVTFALVAYGCIDVLAGATSWEVWFNAETPKEQAIARIGVMFHHAFHITLFSILLACSEFGNPAVVRGALFVNAFSWLINGPWGLTFFDPLCNDFAMCVTQEAADEANFFAIFCVIGFILALVYKPSAAENAE
jgi:hypothetical protein